MHNLGLSYYCANGVPYALIHKSYTAGWANLQKQYTAGYPIFLHKGLHEKITETACVSMLALKINYNLGSAFKLLSATILSSAKFYLSEL